MPFKRRFCSFHKKSFLIRKIYVKIILIDYQITQINYRFILYDNGTVWTNHRLSVKAPCALDLRTFPFDTQTCSLEFESYSHNNEEVNTKIEIFVTCFFCQVSLHWMADPVTMMKIIQLPDFDMVQFDTKREIR